MHYIAEMRKNMNDKEREQMRVSDITVRGIRTRRERK
jgi:hypothetical protein